MRNQTARRAVACLAMIVGIAAAAQLVLANDALPILVTTVNPLPTPAADSYGSVSIRFSPSGLLYVWDGADVWRQSVLNGNSFTHVGSVPTAGADPGPINFSQDGSTLLIGNGAGGMDFSGQSNGLLYTMPVGGSSAAEAGTVFYHFDFVPAPASSALPATATKYLIDIGTAGYGASSVVLFDSAAGSAATRTIVQNVPGASTAIAFDSEHRLYVGVGYDPSFVHQGQIRRFDLADVDAAATGTPLEWSSGSLFNAVSNNSGSGMFFDARGYLFVGGQDGVTVFNKNGVAKSYVVAPYSYPSVSYNSANDQFSVQLYGDPHLSIYNAGAFGFASTWNVNQSGSFIEPANWDAAMPQGAGVAAAFGKGQGDSGNPAALGVTVDGAVRLGSLLFDSQNTAFTLAADGVSGHGITLDNSGGGAVVTANAGGHVIAADVVLADAGGHVFNISDGASLTLAGAVTASDGGKSLTKIGTGALEIDGKLTLPDNGAIRIAAGTLRLKLAAGSQSIGFGITATVAGSAVLELAGSASALSAPAAENPAVTNRTDIRNDSSAIAGLLVTSAGQQVGGIDGTGNLAVADGASLIADHIRQNSLTIGAGATFTLAPSDAFGNPLAEANSLLRAAASGTRMILPASSARIAATPLVSTNPGGTAITIDSPGSAIISAVPEPTAFSLMLVASLLALGVSGVRGQESGVSKCGTGKRSLPVSWGWHRQGIKAKLN